MGQDVAFGFRQLARDPGFFALILITLALGMGANVAVFSVANAVVLSPLPYFEPERLVAIWEANLVEGKDHERVAPPNFADYRALEQIFEDAAAWWRFDANLTDGVGEAQRVGTVECTANLFEVLGVSPRLGSGFPMADRLYDENLAAVISHRLWRGRYGSDLAIVGRPITLNGKSFTVVGVMDASFDFPRDVDVWQRQSWDFSARTRFAHFMEVVGRLQPGISLEQVQADLTALSDRLGREHGASNASWRARAIPLHTEIVGESGPALWVLLMAVVVLMLLAALNVANLLLLRASLREQEMGIRAAVGASPARLLRQVLTEALLLAAGSALAGFALAYLLVKLFVVLQPIDVPRLAEVAFDERVLAFGGLVTLLTAAIFGTVPALHLYRPSFQTILRQTGATAAAGGVAARRTRAALVVVEIGLAMALLVGAGLLLRTVGRLLDQNPGFEPGNSVVVSLELPLALYPDWTRVAQLYSELLEQLETHSGLGAVGVTSFLPLDPAWIVGYTVPDQPEQVPGETLRAQYVTLSPGYVEALRIPLLAGRTFDDRDTADSPAVVLINEQMAKVTWASPTATVGKTIRVGTRGFGPLGRAFKESPEYEIIGVIADVKNNDLEKGADPALYFVHTQFPYRAMSLVLDGEGTPEQRIAVVREELRRLDPGLPLGRAQTLAALLSRTTARARFVTDLMIGFASLAIFLAAIGIYGVLSYGVRCRRHELAIRLSLGASPGELARGVLLEGMILAAGGLILGGLLALTFGSLMRHLLFGVATTDVLVFLGATMTIVAITLLACARPARYASRVALLGSS